MHYASAPHGPVVRAFVHELKRRKVELEFKPATAGEAKAGTVYELESHPAVSLGFWARQNTGKMKPPGRRSPQELPKYKGALPEHANARKWIWEQLVQCLTELPAGCPVPSTDDELDALVAAINAFQLATGVGDWFGTVDTGYFLTPRVLGEVRFSDLWSGCSPDGSTAPGGLADPDH